MRRSRRISAAVLFAAVALATVATTAKALTGAYWGYNNLSATNPPNATCSYNGRVWPAGFACSGWGNWDISWVDWTSGSGKFIFGFICQSDDSLHGPILNGAGGDVPAFYSTVYYADCPGHYNHAAVGHVGGTYNYLQAGKN